MDYEDVPVKQNTSCKTCGKAFSVSLRNTGGKLEYLEIRGDCLHVLEVWREGSQLYARMTVDAKLVA